MLKILERERKELQDQILAEIDTTELVYMEEALEALKKQEEKLNNQAEIPKVSEVELKVDDAPTVYEEQAANTDRIDWFDEDEGAACMEHIQEHLADLAICSHAATDIAIEESSLNPDALEFEIKDLNDNEVEEFPLIESPPPPDNEQAFDDNLLTDIDKDNQAKYFYFYQGDYQITMKL